jgi:hypothetical protein
VGIKAAAPANDGIIFNRFHQKEITTGTQDAVGFSQRPRHVADMVQDVLNVDDVDAGGRQGNIQPAGDHDRAVGGGMLYPLWYHIKAEGENGRIVENDSYSSRRTAHIQNAYRLRPLHQRLLHGKIGQHLIATGRPIFPKNNRFTIIHTWLRET